MTMYAAQAGYRLLIYLGWNNFGVNSLVASSRETDPRWCGTSLCTIKKLSVSF